MKDLDRLNRARQGHGLSAIGISARPQRFWGKQVAGLTDYAVVQGHPVGNQGKPLYDNDPASPTYGVRRCIVGIDPVDATDCIWF